MLTFVNKYIHTVYHEILVGIINQLLVIATSLAADTQVKLYSSDSLIAGKNAVSFQLLLYIHSLWLDPGSVSYKQRALTCFVFTCTYNISERPQESKHNILNTSI